MLIIDRFGRPTMSSFSNRRSAPLGFMTGSNLLMGDMIEILARRNPKASPESVETAARATAAVSDAITKLSPERQKNLADHQKDLPDIIAAIADKFEAIPERLELQASGPIETMEGMGLNPTLTYEEGLQLVRSYATPTRLEVWAGPVASPTELEKDYGIKRSTLHDWRQNGSIIGLLKGTRKHVFPIAQFIDGRPVQGIAQIMDVIKLPRVAWLWLSRPHPSKDGTAPIERLKSNRVAEVLEVAEHDFGQS
jgi:hypothetical protein